MAPMASPFFTYKIGKEPNLFLQEDVKIISKLKDTTSIAFINSFHLGEQLGSFKPL
jgi:hypothetical protein